MNEMFYNNYDINSTIRKNIECILKTWIYGFQNMSLFKPTGIEHKYPRVLQLPLTYRCNSNCVMCNIPAMKKQYEMNTIEFKKALADPIFSKIESVGINGGEPFLIKELEEYVKIILALPNLKAVNIITNGFLVKRMEQILPSIYKMCRRKNVRFDISISLDGYGEVHDKVRGVPGGFEKTLASINYVKNNRKNVCNSFEVGCTISKINVDYAIQLQEFCREMKIPLKFRLAIDNKRIDSYSIHDQFSVFSSEKTQQSAKEIFFRLMNEDRNNKFKYFAIFDFLRKDNNKRNLGCDWQKNGITMDAGGNIYYCAVESKKLGNILEESGLRIFFDWRNLQYRSVLISKKCKNCIHDYGGKPTIYQVYRYNKYFIEQEMKYKDNNLGG